MAKLLASRRIAVRDAVDDIKCQRGVDPTFDSGDNETRLTAALASTAHYYSPILPGGDIEIPNTVVMPERWGCAIRGAGGIAKDLGENHFSGDLQGSKQCSRLIWKGADEG